MAVKTASTGYFTIPSSPAGGVAITSGAANTYTASFVQLQSSTSAALYIVGVSGFNSSVSKPTYVHFQIATGTAGSESTVSIVPIAYVTAGFTGQTTTG